jgi:hypothetical protein
MFQIFLFFIWSLFLSSKSVVNAGPAHEAKQLLRDAAVIEGIKVQCRDKLEKFKPMKDHLKERGKILRANGVRDLHKYSPDYTEVNAYISWACGVNTATHAGLPAYEHIADRFSSIQSSTGSDFDAVADAFKADDELDTNEDLSMEAVCSKNQGYLVHALLFVLGLLLGAITCFFFTSSANRGVSNPKTLRRPEL